MQHIGLLAPAVAGLALSTAALGAQHGAEHHAYPAPAHVLYDVAADGALFAAGTNYKARADASGFTFVPFLGSDAPRNFPVRFSLESIETDGLRRAVGPPAEVSRDGSVMRLTRQGVEARYTLAPDHVEQAFLIEEPGSGDVRVSLAVESELQLTHSAVGLSFESALGRVHYGAATAFAPDGRSCAVETFASSIGLDLVVPASFVASCDGPLLIDPILSSGVLASPGAGWTAVASDVGADEDVGYAVVIERTFSATDHDVFAYRRSASTASVTAVYVGPIDITFEDWRQPSIAGRNSGNEFLVAARAGSSPSTRIAARVVDGDGWTIGLPFDLSGSSRANAPDVGSDRAGSFILRPSWFVVWEEEPQVGNRNIRGRQVRENAVLGPVTTFAGSFLDEFAPKLGESAGSSTSSADVRYTLAYRRDAAVGFDLIVRQFNRAGTTVEGPTTITTPLLLADHDVSGPSDVIASNGERAYLLVLESRALLGSARSLQALVCGGAELLETTSITEMTGDQIGEQQMNPAVACDGERWMIAYEEVPENASQTNVMFCSGNLAGDRFGLAERREPLSVTPQAEVGPAIASLWEGGSDSGQAVLALVTWTREFAPGLTGGAHVRSALDLVNGTQYCEPTDNSTFRPGWISIVGSRSASTPKHITCEDLPPGATTFVLVSRETAFVPAVGGSAGNLCLGGNGFGRFSNLAGPTTADGRYQVSISPTAIPQANGSVAALPGETWYFQGWFRDFQNGAVTSNLTNGFAIQFD
ncbi:MAG: hypothetical protein AAGB93_19570 [Planctomycetota bacterium]